MLQLRGRCVATAQIILLTFWLGTVVLVGGTAAEPIEISDAEDLQNISGDLDADYVLVDDVDLSGVKFEPIGSEDQPFNGSFDGDGHIINNLSVAAESGGIGVFGATGQGVVVENLSLHQVEMEALDDFATPVGTVTGFNQGEIRNVKIMGRVEGFGSVGGVAGYNNGSLRELSFAGRVSGNRDVGGITGGSLGGEILNSSSSGEITIEVSRGGGLIGTSTLSTLKNSRSNASVSGGSGVGGLVGMNIKSDIIQSYSTGDVTGDKAVGGIAGTHGPGTIEASYAIGNVKGETYVGGLSGLNQGRISNSYFLGSVSGDNHTGGLAGYHGGEDIRQGTVVVLENTEWRTDNFTHPAVGTVETGNGSVVIKNVTPAMEEPETDQEDNQTADDDGEDLPGFTSAVALTALFSLLLTRAKTKHR